MQLPEALNQKFDDMARSYSEDKQMPVLSRIEVKAQEKGRLLGVEKGTRNTLVNVLSQKFTNIPSDILKQLNSLNDLQQINAIVAQVYELKTLEQLRQLLDSFSQRNN